ncbi:hypothetical protein BMI86_00195 [Thioclava sp. DLFJ5-1]|nr:hypothetical protein BMI86_00195 [Thioclava sp. DLFJ5-1]
MQQAAPMLQEQTNAKEPFDSLNLRNSHAVIQLLMGPKHHPKSTRASGSRTEIDNSKLTFAAQAIDVGYGPTATL